MEDEKGGAGTSCFRSSLTDKEGLRQRVMKGRRALKQVLVNIEGARELRLVVTDAGDGIDCDQADWAEVKLVSK